MIQTHDHGAVRELQLDKPPANALDLELLGSLLEAVRSAPADGVRALVLSGRPGMFSAGLDVPRFLSLGPEAVREAWGVFLEVMEALATSSVPVGAALTGHAPAGGCVLALFCDYRVMADGSFKIGLNEVEVGLPMPPVLQAALAHAVGPRRAEVLATSATLVDAQEAFRIGLVDELAPPEEVVPRTLAWAERLVALPPIALRRTRETARADVLAALARPGQLDAVVEDWCSDETQGALKALVARLAAKKK